MLLPFDDSSTALQKNVEISGKKIDGTQNPCEVLDDFTKYSEAICNLEANEIIAAQSTPNNDLGFCGFGALSDCDCSKSSFQSYLFTPTTSAASSDHNLALETSISLQSTDATQTFYIPDTISSVCGNADGFSKCIRSNTSLIDKLTGLTVTTYPYKGWTASTASSTLTLDPAQADPHSEFTLTMSLSAAPSVVISKDFIVDVA